MSAAADVEIAHGVSGLGQALDPPIAQAESCKLDAAVALQPEVQPPAVGGPAGLQRIPVE
jgi:hypothetical protein